MKPFADRCRAPSGAVLRPSVALATFVLLAACDRVALPSQLPVRAAPRADTAMSLPIDTMSTRGDTASIATDSAVTFPLVDSVAAPVDSGPLTALPAELPRIQVDARYPATRRVVSIPSNGDLQAAIDSARPGDVLLLPKGATYVGNFNLPDKGPSTEWIVVRTDATDAELGPEGTRMTPSRAATVRLASIVATNSTSAIGTDQGAHHYRFTGVEISAPAAVDELNALVRFGDNTTAQFSPATTAHDLVIDRSYLHGAPTLALRRCLMLNSAATAVIDSWLADCHSNESDSQAIVGWNGPGPYLIQNNHLEAGHEVVMFGGGGMTTPGASPSDVTIRGNHFTRPLAWKGVWQVKNLLETKHVRRLLVEGNVFENNWEDAQAGFAFVLKSENQDWDTPWTQSTDITIRYNRVRSTGSGWNVAANPSGAPAVPAARIAITDNILEDVNVPPFNGDGHTFQILGGLADVVLAHNTILGAPGGSATAVVFGGMPTMQRLVVHSNVLAYGAYGVKGDDSSPGRASLAMYAPAAVLTRNVFVGGGVASDYPAGNFFVRAVATVGFASVTARDYHLVGPNFRARGLDLRDLGADIDRVEAATKNAVVAP